MTSEERVREDTEHPCGACGAPFSVTEFKVHGEWVPHSSECSASCWKQDEEAYNTAYWKRRSGGIV